MHMTPSHRTARSFLPRGLLSLALMLVLSGCSPGPVEWNGKDISELMPELAYQLVDEQGNPTTAEDYAGQVRLLFFGFTHCPDICPATLAHLRNALREIPEQQRDDVTVLFVSVDPKRDDPEVLAEYTGYFGPNFVGMTGTEPELRKLSQRYRTTFGYGETDAEGHYDVSHSSAIYAFDREGNARLLLRSELTPEQIAEDLTHLLNEDR